MIDGIPVTQKLGCHKYALDNCILVKASVEAVSTVVKQHFELEVQSHGKLADYIDAKNASWKEVERQRQVRNSRPNKSLPPVLWAIPFWRYLNHQWTILPLSGAEDSIAFAFASLLSTDTITFHDSDHASVSEFKVFHNNKFIEHYLFGYECGKLLEDYWDISVNFELFESRSEHQEHHFKSLIRQATESEVRMALAARKNDKDDRGFLNACLKYHSAYIPQLEETPYHHHVEWNSDFQKWDSIVEQMDMIIVPSSWSYLDWKVPDRVA